MKKSKMIKKNEIFDKGPNLKPQGIVICSDLSFFPSSSKMMNDETMFSSHFSKTWHTYRQCGVGVFSLWQTGSEGK